MAYDNKQETRERLMDEAELATPEYVDRMIFEAMAPKVPCLVCGEDVPLLFEDVFGGKSAVKVCDKCKAAILMVRGHIEDAAAGKAILD